MVEFKSRTNWAAYGFWQPWQLEWQIKPMRFDKNHGFIFRINGIVYREWNDEFIKAYTWEKLVEKG